MAKPTNPGNPNHPHGPKNGGAAGAADAAVEKRLGQLEADVAFLAEKLGVTLPSNGTDTPAPTPAPVPAPTPDPVPAPTTDPNAPAAPTA